MRYLAFLLWPVLISAMSVEEKVGQLFMTWVADAQDPLIDELHLGGVIYYGWANDLEGPSQVACLSRQLQERAATLSLPPMLIAVDQEGGRVTRLRKGFTSLPSNAEVAALGDPELAYRLAYMAGDELRAAGIHMNFAPVVDRANDLNPAVGDRAYSHDPEEVILYARAALAGYRDAGVVPVLKHFPGHGASVRDSHEELPSIIGDATQELRPFVALCDETPAIMVGHLVLADVDPFVPASLSKRVVEGLLCNEMGFKGLVVADSLTMGAVHANCPDLGEAVLQAFEAGCDLLLFGEQDEAHADEMRQVFTTFCRAVYSGRITEERLDRSLQKLLTLKGEL